MKQARSTLLPQIDLDAAGIAIDEDRARVSLGVQPERSVSGSATLSQLIYSEDAWSNYRVEKHLQVSREEQRDTVRLDITRDAAVTYLNVLRTKTLEGIQKENLKLTRANLDRARVRVSIGVASRAEEFRWESEIANVRRDVLQAQARRQQAETNFNRLLNRPLEEPFLTEEADLRDPVLLISDQRFFFYVDNPRNFSLFRDFLVEEGLATAPELKQFDAAIAAQERILMTSKRAFWVPTFAFEGSVTELLAEGGAGTREDSLAGLNNTDWSLGLFATFPLVEGGGKFATIKRAREDLSSLRLDRQSTAEKVAERIRVALDETGFSYPNIGLSRDAAEAAKKNLHLVTDSYERGVVSIIDLLDAQNNALVAVEEAENAVYNFLTDLMDVQRAIGKFDFFLSPQEREAWFQRLKKFYIRAGVAPGKR
ncbi:MAG: TolC family protein [Deltaproteobacteria bacterium]|nr:MAG: TolC family protein [Deltaproteobacteria bacterium]